MAMSKKEVRELADVQDLVGSALSAYQNDRAPDRAEKVMRPLEQALNKCIELLAKYPPQVPNA